MGRRGQFRKRIDKAVSCIMAVMLVVMFVPAGAIAEIEEQVQGGAIGMPETATASEAEEEGAEPVAEPAEEEPEAESISESNWVSGVEVKDPANEPNRELDEVAEGPMPEPDAETPETPTQPEAISEEAPAADIPVQFGEAPLAEALSSPASESNTVSEVASPREKVADLQVQAAASDASGHFHAAISTNKESYTGGSTAQVSVKYTIDRASIHEGDYVYVQLPADIVASASFSVSPQHFSGVEDLGDGRYKLTFGSGAESALTGSFNMFVTTKEVAQETPGTIEVGNAAATITVTPGAGGGGVGTYTDTIMKDASDNGSKVHFGDYDYSEGDGDNAAQIGMYDSTNDENLKFRLFVNDKKAAVSRVTVVDTLPGGMSFDASRAVEVLDQATGTPIDPALYTVGISGGTLTFTYPGEFSNTIQINYWVDVKGGQSVKYTNRAEIAYTQEGVAHGEHRNYVLQGNDFSAANGEKSVDKTVVSTDPDDQWVTYTIKFWQQGGFDAGEINLVDALDQYVDFLYADGLSGFDVSYDAVAHAVKIRNTQRVTGTQYVRFTVDFSRVPAGHAVSNTVGGNTVVTVKDLPFSLKGTKTVDGDTPAAGAAFDFELLDEAGQVVSSATSNADGSFAFSGLVFSGDDIGRTFTYTVREGEASAAGYTVSPSGYTVDLTPRLEGDSLVVQPIFKADGEDADALSFDNVPDKPAATELAVGKEWVSVEGEPIAWPEGARVEVAVSEQDDATGAMERVDGATLTADNPSATFTGLPVNEGKSYTVSEVAPVEGYAAKVSGGQEDDGSYAFTITNKKQEPKLEKYIEGDVDGEADSFDGTFDFQVLAYITEDAEKARIVDDLVDALVFTGTAEQVSVRDMGEANDHTAGGTVSGQGSTIAASAGVQSRIAGKRLQVDIADCTTLRGHWVMVEFACGFDRDVVENVDSFKRVEVHVGENETIVTAIGEREGIPNEASYDIFIADKPAYSYVSEPTTVNPPTTQVSVAKKWLEDGKEVSWPEGAEVEVTLCQYGQLTGQTATLTAENPTAVFANLPVLEEGEYTVRETAVSGAPEGAEATVSGSNGDFTITNAYATTPPDAPHAPQGPDVEDGKPKVSAVKSVDKARVEPGGQLAYSIVVRNDSDVDARDVFVKDFVPAYTTFVGVSSAHGGKYGATTAGREYATWNIGSLAAHSSETLTLTVKVNECVDGTRLRNTAYYQVGKDVPKPAETPGNPTNTVITTVDKQGGGVIGRVARAIVRTGDDLPVGPALAVMLASGAGLLALRSRREGAA